ncbi:MAG: hypothetical protein KDI88_06435 [Gammaproteobacteria bacterium]|nr:hypothetical protein [Gammaproteobacteria bacterium]
MGEQESNSRGLDVGDYLQRFAPYAEQLADFRVSEREYGGRFALLFRLVVRLLVLPDAFNDRIPGLYRSVARRYLDREHDVVLHFSYEENRHFFLSELLDWLKIHQRGQALRRINRSIAP